MTKTVLKKRPELVQLPAVPTILKISEIPSETYVMKINEPFTLTHLAKRGIEKAFFISQTSKSPKTVLGKQIQILKELQDTVTDIIRDNFPLLGKHVIITSQLRIEYGSWNTQKPFYCPNIPKLVDQLNQCGFSDMPLRFFMIPLEESNAWASFVRVKGISGFTLAQVGNALYSDFELDQLKELIKRNEVLQRLRVFICQTSVATGKWMTCVVPDGRELGEEEGEG